MRQTEERTVLTSATNKRDNSRAVRTWFKSKHIEELHCKDHSALGQPGAAKIYTNARRTGMKQSQDRNQFTSIQKSGAATA